MADEKQDLASGDEQAAEPAPEADERPVGQLLVDARTRRGLSAEDITAQTRIPALYLKAIETDNYGMISDQLYLLPFLRRYAVFVGLDPEEVASRFIRDVQRAETNVVRISEPIRMVEPRKRHPLRNFTLGLLLVAGIAILVLLALARLGMLRGGSIPGFGSSAARAPEQSAPTAATQIKSAPPAREPFATSIKPAAAAAAAARPAPPDTDANQPATAGTAR